MRRRAFAWIELLVLIVIVALLVSIVLPSLTRAKELACGAVCLSNMRSTGMASQMYTNNEHYPPGSCGLHDNPAESL